MKLIDCKQLADEVKEQVREDVSKCERSPHLLVITVGQDVGSEIYVRNKKRVAESVGIEIEHITFSEKTSQEMLETFIEMKGQNPDIDGILVQLPLPNHLEPSQIMDKIPKDKDVDGFTWRNLGHALIDAPHHTACTPKAILHIIEQEFPNIEGTVVTVIGRSNIVGKPLVAELINAGATVTVCNSRTPKNVLTTVCQQSDIVIVAAGVPKLIGYQELKNTQLVIDVGINKIGNSIQGDVDAGDLERHNYNGAITPVPGGVGLLTVAFLMQNVFDAYAKQHPNLLHTQKVENGADAPTPLHSRNTTKH